MKCFKNRYNNLSYIIFTILSLFSISLIFNNNVWFDEAYTLSLIQHNYSEVIEILKSDMHPPLYFISLKFFCEIFGYSILVTKIFSVLGYIATLLLGCTVVKKHFGSDTSMVYMLTIGAIPMSLYFSVQQRSYQWSIFFVTLCFSEALLFLENHGTRHCVIFVITALFAAYNHIYALLAVGVIFIFVNIYAFVKDGKLIKAIIISDIAMTVGYSPWIIPLLYQTEAAAGSFWLKGGCVCIGNCYFDADTRQKGKPQVICNICDNLRIKRSGNRSACDNFHSPLLHSEVQRCYIGNFRAACRFWHTTYKRKS